MKKELFELDMYVQAFLNELEQSQRYTLNTQMAYDNDLRHFIAFLSNYLNRKPYLDDLNPTVIRTYLMYETYAGLSPNTTYRRQITIKKFLNYLKVNEHAKVYNQEYELNRLRVQLNQQKKELVQFDIIRQEDTDRLLAVMETARLPHSTRDQAIFMLLLDTGLSVKRLVRMNLADFNANRGQIRPKQGVQKWLSLDTSTAYIERYLAIGRPDLNSQSDEDALFISQMGCRLSRQGIWQIIEHWGRAAQPPISVSPRRLRNTAAIKLINSGRPLEEIQLLLGHKNQNSTLALWRRLKNAGLLATNSKHAII